MTEQHNIYWNGDEVGTIAISASDMWYFEGTFSPNESKAAEDFMKAADRLDLKVVYRNPTKGIFCVLSPVLGLDKKWNAIVLGKLDELLVLRMTTTASRPASFLSRLRIYSRRFIDSLFHRSRV